MVQIFSGCNLREERDQEPEPSQFPPGSLEVKDAKPNANNPAIMFVQWAPHVTSICQTNVWHSWCSVNWRGQSMVTFSTVHHPQESSMSSICVQFLWWIHFQGVASFIAIANWVGDVHCTSMIDQLCYNTFVRKVGSFIRATLDDMFCWKPWLMAYYMAYYVQQRKAKLNSQCIGKRKQTVLDWQSLCRIGSLQAWFSGSLRVTCWTKKMAKVFQRPSCQRLKHCAGSTK